MKSLFRHQVIQSLIPVDALILCFLLILSVIALFAPGRTSVILIGGNIAGGAAIIFVALLAARSPIPAARLLHNWYPAVAIFPIFKEIYIIIQSLGLHDWDDILIAADRWLFGTDPTVWLARYSSPLITEILQISYASYYFIMIAVAWELIARHENEKFSFALFALVYGFFLSYLGYLLFPAAGPRFTLHHFENLGTDLPGVWCTDWIRSILDAGESIPTGAADAIRYAQRDVFPSGHTQMTLIACTLAYRYRCSSRRIITVFGTLLIISTVYLRYHYVIDVIGGMIFFLLTMATAPGLYGWWEKRKREIKNYEL